VLTQIKSPLVSGLWSLDSADSKPGIWFRRVTICPHTCYDTKAPSSSGRTLIVYDRRPLPSGRTAEMHTALLAWQYIRNNRAIGTRGLRASTREQKIYV
jgi:hypothetical protein